MRNLASSRAWHGHNEPLLGDEGVGIAGAVSYHGLKQPADEGQELMRLQIPRGFGHFEQRHGVFGLILRQHLEFQVPAA